MSGRTDWTEFAGLKIVQGIGIVLVIMLALTICVGVFTNKPVNLFGLKFNVIETVYVHDTTITTVHDTTIVVRSASLADNKKSSIIQNNKSGKNEVNQNSGNNSGQIGGSNNTQNNIGIIPRKVTEENLESLIKRARKDATVYFIAYGGVDAELTSVQHQITAILQKHGFTNIAKTYNLKFGAELPPDIQIEYDTVGNVITFFVPPAQ